MLWRFVHLIRRFRREIEDRIPRYFEANPLRFHLLEEVTLNLARVDDVMEVPQDFFPAAAELTGVRLQVVLDHKEMNAVDKLFCLKVKGLLAHLNGQTLFPVPKDFIQDVVTATGDGTSACLDADDCDWRSWFEEKQLSPQEGVSLNYYVGGRGNKTVVLLNAYGQGFGYWKKFIQAVSAHFRMILWVPRGNDWETVGIKLATPQKVHADDLDLILAQEEIETCTLVAWCSGPKLALEYYSRYRHRVASMVFTAASFKGLPQHKALETTYEKNLEPLLETIEKFPGESEVVLEYLKGILLAQDKRARSMEELSSLSHAELQKALSAVNVSLQDMVLEPFHASNVLAYARQMRDFWKYDFLSSLKMVSIPVLLLGGDCDQIASQPLAKTVAAMIPQAQYLEVQGGTHYLQYDHWDLLAQAVHEVVNSGGRLKLAHPWVNLTVPAKENTSMRENLA